MAEKVYTAIVRGISIAGLRSHAIQTEGYVPNSFNHESLGLDTSTGTEHFRCTWRTK